MTLNMTTRLNLNINQKLIASYVLSDLKSQSLINPRKLLNKLLLNHNDLNKYSYYRLKYHQNLLIISLSFKDLKFRKKYQKWVYSNYSNSLANHKRILQYEIYALTKWAKVFNQNHRHLKFIKIWPEINDHKFRAYLSLISINSTNHKLSFSLKDALINEYGIKDYNQSFYLFEADAGHYLANILQGVFKKCIPGISFSNVPDTFNSVINLKFNNKNKDQSNYNIHKGPKSKKMPRTAYYNNKFVKQMPKRPRESNVIPHSISLNSFYNNSKDSFSTKITHPKSQSSKTSKASIHNYPMVLSSASSFSLLFLITNKSSRAKDKHFLPAHFSKASASSSRSESTSNSSRPRQSTQNQNTPQQKVTKPNHLLALSQQKSYMMTVIIISLIIIALLIIVFPLFRI